MKKILLLLCLLLLSACAQVSAENIPASLDEVFSHDSDENRYILNNRTAYFTYYLPTDMEEKEYGDIYCLFERGDSSILMNVNIGGIISAEYYGRSLLDDGFFDMKDLVYTHTGQFLGIDGEKKLYSYRVFRIEEEYYSTFDSRALRIYGVSSLEGLKDMSFHILQLARTTSVKEEDVVEDFSNKSVIDYQKKEVDLFEKIVPSNGVLEELLIDRPDRNDDGE